MSDFCYTTNTMNTSQTLAQAVAQMTSEAQQAGRFELVLSEQGWTDLVVRYMQGNDNRGFAQDVFNRVGSVKHLDELNHWMALATAIWNATPQPDRGGKSANELLVEERKYLRPLPKRPFSPKKGQKPHHL